MSKSDVVVSLAGDHDTDEEKHDLAVMIIAEAMMDVLHSKDCRHTDAEIWSSIGFLAEQKYVVIEGNG